MDIKKEWVGVLLQAVMNKEVAGYVEALQLVKESYDEIDLIGNNIKYLH